MSIEALATAIQLDQVEPIIETVPGLALEGRPTWSPPVTGNRAGTTGVQPQRSWRLVEARRTFETGFVRAALVRAGGHRGRAAQELGVTRQGLTKLLNRLGIDDSP